MIDAATKRERAAVRALAAKLGATVHEKNSDQWYHVAVEAPKGHHWNDCEVHELVAGCYVGPWTYADEWRDLFTRMSGGVEPCNGACEYWTDDEEDHSNLVRFVQEEQSKARAGQ